MNDTIDICRVSGDILLDGEDIYDPALTPCSCARVLVWCFKNQTHFQIHL